MGDAIVRHFSIDLGVLEKKSFFVDKLQFHKINKVLCYSVFSRYS